MKKLSLKKKSLSINTYGYNYSASDFYTTLALFIVIMAVLCYLHKLNIIYSTIVMITVLVALPFYVTSFYFYKKEKVRFDEFCKYYEYMKIYFKTYKKIKLAMENVILLFDEKSNMYKCIKKAIDEINETSNYAVALGYIDNQYHNSYLERFHSLLVIGEKQGCDTIYDSLDLVNFESWKSDIQKHQINKKGLRYMMFVMLLIAIVISIYGVKMFEYFPSVYSDSTFQLYTFVNIELMFICFTMAYVSVVSKKWLRSDD